MSHLTSLGTLFAFMIVALAVLVLRFKKPTLKRPFRCPAVYIIAPVAILSCGYLIFTLFGESGKPFMIWTAIGIVMYFLYAYRRSPLNPRNKEEVVIHLS